MVVLKGGEGGEGEIVVVEGMRSRVGLEEMVDKVMVEGRRGRRWWMRIGGGGGG